MLQNRVDHHIGMQVGIAAGAQNGPDEERHILANHFQNCETVIAIISWIYKPGTDKAGFVFAVFTPEPEVFQKGREKVGRNACEQVAVQSRMALRQKLSDQGL